MTRRGRPPHPDILTPREWEVLALLRERLSNEEIASRLGISVDGVKYHVSEILSKLGVATRQEAARWNREERPWWLAAGAPVASLWRRTATFASRLGPLAAVASGTVLLAALAGIFLLGFLLFHARQGAGEGTIASRAVIPTPVRGWPGSFEASFADELHGWTAIRNELFQTNDGGQHWTEEYRADDDISHVDFVTPQVGWLIVAGQLLTSGDGGQTWQRTGLHQAGLVQQLQFVDAKNGWAGGDGFQGFGDNVWGTTSGVKGWSIWRTSDGGASWAPVQDPCPHPLGKLPLGPFSFIDQSTGWIICSAASDVGVPETLLFRTDDGGDQWQLLGSISNAPVSGIQWALTLQFLDQSHGWLLDGSGLYVTENGGRAWLAVAAFPVNPGQLPTMFSTVQFVSRSQGYLNYRGGLPGPSGLGGSSAIFETQDGGTTWTEIYSGPPPLSAPGIRPCPPADLTAIIGGSNGLTGGQIVSDIAFRNKSDTPCTLTGVPQLELLDSEARAIPIAAFSMCGEPNPPWSCGHPLQDVVLAPGTGALKPRSTLEAGQAFLSLYWPTYGNEGPPCTPPSPTATFIRLHLSPGGGDLTVPVAPEFPQGIGPCRRIGVGWFEPSSGVP